MVNSYLDWPLPIDCHSRDMGGGFTSRLRGSVSTSTPRRLSVPIRRQTLEKVYESSSRYWSPRDRVPINLRHVGSGGREKPKTPTSGSPEGMEMAVIQREHIQYSIPLSENHDRSVGKADFEIPIAPQDYDG